MTASRTRRTISWQTFIVKIHESIERVVVDRVADWRNAAGVNLDRLCFVQRMRSCTTRHLPAAKRSDLNESTVEGVSSQTGENAFASGVVLAIAGTFLFALKSIFIKLAFADGCNPTELLTLRLAYALPFYLAVLWWVSRRGSQPAVTRSQTLSAVFLGFLGYYLASYLDLSGLAYISAQLERLTLFTYPALIAILAWIFLGEILTSKIIAAIVLCYAGVYLMYGQEAIHARESQTDGHRDVFWGTLLVMASALSYSIYVLFAKPAIQKMGSRRFTSLAMIGSTFFVFVHYLITENTGALFRLPWTVHVYGMILAFVCTVIPSFMINEAMARIGATRTSVIGTIGPVLTMFLAILVLGEQSSVWHFVGMLSALVGVSLVARR